ncbi:hypothetical protein [Rickettsia sp. TH2014]|uniref:hypothetical protein n=1 Tax=Rickettsia sp. TH2014 TaxID=1967503 RepID=UPI001C488FDB|nr:hypothetical protein [Rickettsia sp. TH2014]
MQQLLVKWLGDVNLNNPNANFNPPFVDGNTIEVINSGNITVSNSGTHNIGAIRADQEVTTISVGNGSTDLAINLTIGSMSGVVKGLNITRFNNATNINITLNGNAGGGNIPLVNDYSALQQVSFTQMGGGIVQIVLI